MLIKIFDGVKDPRKIIPYAIFLSFKDNKVHVRVETRTASAFHAELMENKVVLYRRKNLKTIVKVDTQTVHVSDNGKETMRTGYYISDEDLPSAAYFGDLARNH